MTPVEKLFGVKPNVSHLRVFGSVCYVFVPDHLRSKFEKKAVRCVFTGYDAERKGWRCVDPVTGRIHVSRNVVFDEASSWWSSDHTNLPDSRELEIELQRKMSPDVMLEPALEELVEPSVEETSNRSNSPQNPWRSGVHQIRSAEEMRPSQLNDSENEENVTVLRRSSRIPKPNPRSVFPPSSQPGSCSSRLYRLFANLKKSGSDSKTLGVFFTISIESKYQGCQFSCEKDDMSNVTVCVRFRPLNSREKRDHGDNICIQGLDAESFVFKDEKDGDFMFSFDRVFYQNSAQEDMFDHLAMPIVRDAMNAINGTIITYGQTGAGKTYSMEGPSISECNGQKKGIVPRVVDALFGCMRCAHEGSKYTLKLSMVEIYMERVRDLFDLARDNLQIKESKAQGIFLSGATEICIVDSTQALQAIAGGIANRAVGETQMNMASSRSHCVYLFSVQQESTNDGRVKIGKLLLVDLAGSEKVDKTGAEGRVLEEAKTINKSLSALGNVICALTNGKVNHIPYRDSKLTRILQDALGGNSRTALLCCCSPSSSNASESLSTLRFGARAKHIKASSRVQSNEDKGDVKQVTEYRTNSELRDRLVKKLRVKLNEDDVKLLEELFIVEGIVFDPYPVESYEVAYDNLISQTISSLQQAVEDLVITVDKLKRENNALKVKVAAAENVHLCHMNATGNASYLSEVLDLFGYFSSWIQGSIYQKFQRKGYSEALSIDRPEEGNKIFLVKSDIN
ncbi:hypothetical protein MRB53_025770 [Persea americana]|uniref:Uncharacterized protein n=1 Tax=Persea americana TaxID=3435 RepID=A0ACC2LG84_PERAE|nr:hypothetical protein MRB53_025770 [Persea americana]